MQKFRVNRINFELSIKFCLNHHFQVIKLNINQSLKTIIEKKTTEETNKYCQLTLFRF